MEVILREYKVYIFIPIMLSAIVGTVMTQHIQGFRDELEILDQISLGIQHYPSLILLGIFLGFLAFLYNRYLVLMIKSTAKYHIVPRILCAGFITGVLAYFAPFAMTNITIIDFSLTHQWHLQLLIALLITKFLMTLCALGLGVPGGTIGPILSIGAIAGTCASVVVLTFIPGENLASDYALMGMAGFLAATLNAPLAALLVVVELSKQIEMMVPAMLVIATACIASGQLFNNRSLFTMQLDVQGLSYKKTPIEESLQKIGVLGILQEKFIIRTDLAPENYARTLQACNAGELIIVKKDQENSSTENKNSQIKYFWISNEQHELKQGKMPEHPIEYFLLPLSSQSTLAEVYHALVHQRAGGVYIYDNDINNFLGVVTFEQIRLYLLTGKLHS